MQYGTVNDRSSTGRAYFSLVQENSLCSCSMNHIRYLTQIMLTQEEKIPLMIKLLVLDDKPLLLRVGKDKYAKPSKCS